MMEKNTELTAVIEDLSAEGIGVARVDGMVLFVPEALPGERWKVKVVKVTAKYAVGKAMERVGAASPARCEASCPVYRQCGGCQLQHMTYEAQLQLKQNNVRQCFRQHGFEAPPMRPIVGADDPWRYRNKGLFPFAAGPKGLISGLYAQRSHRVIAADDCLIQSEETVAVMQAVREWARRFHIEPYNEERHTGVLRHVMGRSSSLGETMAVVVTRTAKLPFAEDLIRMLKDAVPRLTSVVHNVNPERTNVAMGKTNKVLWGRSEIREAIGGVEFSLSAASFFQVNKAQTEKLYALAAEAAEVKDGDLVFDAYCGVGTIGQYCAKGKKVKLFGVEIVEKAVEDARVNAEKNGFTDAEYAAGKAEVIMLDMAEKGIRPQVLLVDPPRKGCHPDFLKAAGEMAPERLVYVSCNPATLARDAALLKEEGYTPIWIRPVDMFPQTDGVESVALFERTDSSI